MVTHMIAIGEESGTLPAMLDKIAEFFEEDVETASKQLSSMLEPIILITIGVLVGGMLIALYLPMFSAVINSGLSNKPYGEQRDIADMKDKTKNLIGPQIFSNEIRAVQVSNVSGKIKVSAYGSARLPEGTISGGMISKPEVL